MSLKSFIFVKIQKLLPVKYQLNSYTKDKKSFISEIKMDNFINKNIMQTYIAYEKLPNEILNNIEKLKKINNGWKYIFFSDNEQEQYIKENFYFIYEFYYKYINPKYGVVKADLFRYLYIYREGGVYLDIKSSFDIPLDSIIKDNDLCILSHWNQNKYKGYGLHPEIKNKKGEFLQSFMIYAKGHPFLKSVINNILRNISIYNKFLHLTRGHSVLMLSGPIAYTLAIESVWNSKLCRIVDTDMIGYNYTIYSDSKIHKKLFYYNYRQIHEPIIYKRIIMKKILIICNSTNSDLVSYFKCKINSTKEKEKILAFKNSSIDFDTNIKTFNSSYTNSAFFDKMVPVDFIKSFYLFFIVLTNKVKVVHFTTAHISNLFLSILLKPFNIKQIFTIHDLVPHPGKKAKMIALYNKFIISYLSDNIIAFSKQEIEKQKYKDKFIYMPLTGFSQYIDTPKTGEKTILFFGRMEPYKGFENLENIIKKCNEKNLDYKFIIAGNGHIENIEVLRKFENVEIINRFIDDNEVSELFRQATFTILPYDSATQSGVSILSFAYATPVIAYDVGALGEYIDNNKNGYVVRYKADKEIVKFLNSLDNEIILKMSSMAITIFKEKFSKEACQKLYFDFYHNYDKKIKRMYK